MAALIIFALSMRRLFRFARMRRLHARGYVILTDRYPQAVVPGPMDGPGLVARQPGHGLVKQLTRLEQTIYDWMAGFRLIWCCGSMSILRRLWPASLITGPKPCARKWRMCRTYLLTERLWLIWMRPSPWKPFWQLLRLI